MGLTAHARFQPLGATSGFARSSHTSRRPKSMVRRETRTPYLFPHAIPLCPGKRCEKRTSRRALARWRPSRCLKCLLEVIISLTEVFPSVSSLRRSASISNLTVVVYPNIVDDTEIVFDERGTVRDVLLLCAYSGAD